MTIENSSKLPIATTLYEAWSYCNTKPKAVALLVVLNYLVCAAAFYSWKTIWFWGVLAAMYLLWSGLFRYYFNRKPYLSLETLMSSLVPSSKILVISVLVVTALILLPLLPLFLPLPPQMLDSYSAFLQSNMQENDVVDAGVNLIVTLLSPLIFYRPFFAWISSLIGRSGLLRSAMDKTQGNYWELLLLAIIINIACSIVYYLPIAMGANIYLALLPTSILIVYFNIVLAKMYEYFFLEIEVKPLSD